MVALAKSSLCRIPRLVLPAVSVTVLTWFACQLGAFELARGTDAWWLATHSREPSSGWHQAVYDLVSAVQSTWVWADNPYDQPQWAMLYLVRASMWVFVTLLITSTMRPSFRLTVFGLAYVWSWLCADAIVGLNVFAGMFMAEMQTSRLIPEISFKPLRVLPFLSAVLGLYLMSYPSADQDRMPWSSQLTSIGNELFNEYADLGRLWPDLGAQILCFSIQISPELRRATSMRFFTFLGSISFSVYLLHGPLMRSVLAWMTFGPSWVSGVELVDGVMPIPSKTTLSIVLPLFIGFLIAVASLWTRQVEPWFGRLTKLIQDVATAPTQKAILLK